MQILGCEAGLRKSVLMDFDIIVSFVCLFNIDDEEKGYSWLKKIRHFLLLKMIL